MYATIIFARVATRIAGTSNNDEILTKRIILKSFNDLFRNLKLFIVSRRLQVSEWYSVDEFLYRRNKASIEGGMGDSGGHGGGDIDLK